MIITLKPNFSTSEFVVEEIFLSDKIATKHNKSNKKMLILQKFEINFTQ